MLVVKGSKLPATLPPNLMPNIAPYDRQLPPNEIDPQISKGGPSLSLQLGEFDLSCASLA